MYMNNNNQLNLKEGTWGRVIKLAEKQGKEHMIIFMPCIKKISNARVVEANEDGSISVHWSDNWNLEGDFRTELMQFNENLVLDNLDFEERNELRSKNGLDLIKL